jgi:hypothetical protein
MAFGAFFADVLANLEFAQLTDDRRADDQAHEQRRKAGKSRAESNVPENAKWRKMNEQPLIKKPVKQYSSESSLQGKATHSFPPYNNQCWP